jgi:hypothetical protein
MARDPASADAAPDGSIVSSMRGTAHPALRSLGEIAIGGTLASVTSALALGVASKAEGKAVAQPLNATSHWLRGDRAASVKRADLRHTSLGYATHLAATLFWAAIFRQWTSRRPPTAPLPMLRDAMAMSAIAAAVDYTVTPHRFTPGWELNLSKRSMGLAYVAMGLGLAAGALLTQRKVQSTA